VTEDKDLLVLENKLGVEIVDTQRFIELFEAEDKV